MISKVAVQEFEYHVAYDRHRVFQRIVLSSLWRQLVVGRDVAHQQIILNQELYKLREQASECHGIGLGSALAELMAQSPHANFLKPITLALRVAAGEADALDGIPPELRTMAEEVMRDIVPQDRKEVGN